MLLTTLHIRRISTVINDELAKATPRVKVFRTGKTEEGRDFLLVAISDEQNIAQLDKNGSRRDVSSGIARVDSK